MDYAQGGSGTYYGSEEDKPVNDSRVPPKEEEPTESTDDTDNSLDLFKSVTLSLLQGLKESIVAPFTKEYWEGVGTFIQHPINTTVYSLNTALFVLTKGTPEEQARMFGGMIVGISFG